MKSKAAYHHRPRFLSPVISVKTGQATLARAINGVFVPVWLPLLIAIIPLVIYWPVLYSGFVSDDYFYHSVFKWGLWDFLKLLARQNPAEAFVYPYFRPVAFASFKLDYLVWGDDAVGFHFTNLVLHSANCVLLFYLMKSLGLGVRSAALGSVFFGLFPAHPEAVTWISGRFDVLALTWLLGSMLFWCGARLRSDDRLFFSSAFLFLLATLTKEVSVAGLLVLPMMDWLISLRTKRESGQGIGFSWKWYVVFLAIAVSVVALRLRIFGDLGGYLNEGLRDSYLAGGTGPALSNLVLHDLKILLAPVNRELWTQWGGDIRGVLIALAVLYYLGLAGSVLGAFAWLKRIDETPVARLGLGAVWILAFLLPVAPVAAVTNSLDWSRFLYIPTAGLSILTASAIETGFTQKRLISVITAIIIAVMLLASPALLRAHNSAWIEAGGVAAQINAVMETNTGWLPDDSNIFAVNYPWLWKGAHCAPVEYGGYLEYAFDRKNVRTIIMRMNPSGVVDWWYEIARRWQVPSAGFVWDPGKNRLSVLPGIIPIPRQPGAPMDIVGQEIPPR